jgi:hypothetical protein
MPMCLTDLLILKRNQIVVVITELFGTKFRLQAG